MPSRIKEQGGKESSLSLNVWESNSAKYIPWQVFITRSNRSNNNFESEEFAVYLLRVKKKHENMKAF